MSNISDFRMKLLKEQNEVNQQLFKIKNILLSDIKYIDNKILLEYLDQIQAIADSINERYKLKLNSV